MMTEFRNSKLAKAREIRDLGNYGKALTLFREIETELNDLALATEISGLLLEQGSVERAHENIRNALETMSEGQEAIVISKAEVVRAVTSAFMTGIFSAALNDVSSVYAKYLADSAAPDYTKNMISIEVLHYHLNSVAVGLGNTVNSSKTSQEKLKEIFHHSLRRGWFGEARTLAIVYAGPAGVLSNWEGVPVTPDRLELLEILLKDSAVTDLVRAESMVSLSDLLREVNQVPRSEALEKDAKKLFKKVGHACGGALIELGWCKRSPSKLKPADRIRKLDAIKTDLEKLENWAGVGEAARAMYEIAMDSSDFDLMEELDKEILRIKALAGPSIHWSTWQILTFMRWNFPGGNTAKLLTSLLALHATLEGMEQPRMTDLTAVQIAKTYHTLGDTVKAQEWMDKALKDSKKYSKIETKDQDPFIVALIATTTKPDHELEYGELRVNLDRIAAEAGVNVAISERFVAVMKMSNICNYYLNQVQIRGVETTKLLVTSCLERARPLLESIATDQAILWRGSLMQVDARLAFIESLIGGSTVNMELLGSALELNQSVVQYYKKNGLRLQMAFALQNLATCQEQLWIQDGRSPTSKNFISAVRSYESAGRCFDIGRYSDNLRMNTRFRLKLWLSGYRAKVQLSTGYLFSAVAWLLLVFGFKYNKPSVLQEVEKCLKSLESMVDAQRHDLSALHNEQALLAKQSLRSNDDALAILDASITVYGTENDIQSVWNTIQKSKARSVSDLLGLGVNIPQWLQNAIDADSEARILFQQEADYMVKIENDSTDNQFQLRKDLDIHRRAMRRVPCLRHLLELREGRPVSASKLRAIRDVQNAYGDSRQIFFADWLIYSGKVWLIVVTPDSTPLYDTGILAKDLDTWMKENISGAPLNEPLNDDDLSPLQELSKLVEPLVALAREGDLLVLCPSGVLNYIPIHAATTSTNSEQSLIERNPIVYCPSMTVFEQCVLRANGRSGPGPEATHAMLAVYEKPGKDDWKVARDNAYEMCKTLGSKMANCKVFTGAAVDKARFKIECETAETVHFLGHCHTKNNAMKQLIEISAESSGTLEDGVKTSRGLLAAYEVPPGFFTISDIFATFIHASHFNLIACGSASQHVNQGDEPWGIVTALLCAGATSVGGTMWEVQFGTGREFMKSMYTDFYRRSGQGESVLDLAVALQETVKRMKEDPNKSQPYHWAAFVLHGSWFHR